MGDTLSRDEPVNTIIEDGGNTLHIERENLDTIMEGHESKEDDASTSGVPSIGIINSCPNPRHLPRKRSRQRSLSVIDIPVQEILKQPHTLDLPNINVDIPPDLDTVEYVRAWTNDTDDEQPKLQPSIKAKSEATRHTQQHSKPLSPKPLPPMYQNESPITLAMSLIPPRNQCLSIWRIFKCRRQLGKGATGRVLLVEHKENGKLYALKEMNRSIDKNHTLFHSEVCILSQMKHENIVELYDVYMDNYNYYICLEYCSGGTILERIISDTYFNEQMAANLVQTMLKTIAFLHSNNIAHLDLKLNNIVFNKKKSELGKNELPKLKIIDFGLSEHIHDDAYIYDEIHGSLHYFPPEIFTDGRSGKQLKDGDVWAIGVCVYLTVSGKLPFYGDSQREIIKSIQRGIFNWPQNVNLSQDCKSFISELLNPDSSQRISAECALKHKWIVNTSNNIYDNPSEDVDEDTQMIAGLMDELADEFKGYVSEHDDSYDTAPIPIQLTFPDIETKIDDDDEEKLTLKMTLINKSSSSKSGHVISQSVTELADLKVEIQDSDDYDFADSVVRDLPQLATPQLPSTQFSTFQSTNTYYIE